MSAFFFDLQGFMRVDTRTPLWLDKDQITTWLAKQNKNEKERRKAAAKKAAEKTKTEAETKKVTQWHQQANQES
jgi:hypothetical protein